MNRRSFVRNSCALGVTLSLPCGVATAQQVKQLEKQPAGKQEAQDNLENDVDETATKRPQLRDHVFPLHAGVVVRHQLNGPVPSQPERSATI